MSPHLDPDLARLLAEAGQEHLVAHARRLPGEEGAAFVAAAAAHPWAEIRAAVSGDNAPPGPPPVLRPPHALTLGRQWGEGGTRRALAKTGRALIAGGRVATLLLAGGQGSRLGFDGPKGNFVLGPEEDRTLYAILAERVAAASRESGQTVPFYVLVSPSTEAVTRKAFDDGAERWGLTEDQVQIVVQRQLPAIDAEGRALIAPDGQLALAPDGHGGALVALHQAGVLDDLADRGVDVLTTFQVDNPLGLPLDPVMLGWMVERRAEAIGKAVRRLPDEKVGVYVRDIEGRHRIVEYSEFPEGGLPEELKMGSIALHGFAVRWLRDLFTGGLGLPYHLAHKKVPHLDAAGEVVTPEAPNAHKLELFIFDAIPLAERAEVHEVVREREFAPVKNAAGTDSAETARTLVEAEVKRLCEANGQPHPDPVSLHPLNLPDGV